MNSNDAMFAQIEGLNAGFMEDVKAGKPDALAKRYTEDAHFIVGGQPPVIGHAALEAQFAGMIGAGVAELRISMDEVEADDTTAWEGGGYAMFAPDGTPIDSGRYIVIWKKTADGWKIHRDIVTSTVVQA